jgi:prophage DNA circulation protein
MSTTQDFCDAVSAAMEALRAAINDPLDQIRLLGGLAAFQPSPTDAAGQATAAVCRRSALASLARATADWQPTSSTEATAILSIIKPVFDQEIRYAADHGDITTYQQLRDLRAAVVNDIRQRGSQLPELVTISRGKPLPSLVLAYELYADARRQTELTTRNASVIHPAMFPTSFEALSW